MSYSSFWGFCGLAILLLLHGIYMLPAGKRIDTLQELKKKNRRLWITMSVTIVLCAAVFVSGIVMMFIQMEAPAVHCMGLLVLLVSFLLNGQLRRCGKDAEDNEE